MVADTQETHGAGSGMRDEKEYVEKLYVPENLSYPIAVGGAGLDEPIEAFSLELFERVEKHPPATINELRTTIRAAIEEVHSSDAKLSAWPRMYRTTKCIVAAKPMNDDFAIFVTTGKRVSYRKREPVIVGYDTPANKALLTRMYRPTIPVAEGIILGAYLVAQSKRLDKGVGGDTRIATVASHGAFIEDEKYIELLEQRAEELLTAFNDLFLVAADVAVHDFEFDKILEEFKTSVKENRRKYHVATSLSMFEKMMDPKWKGDAYAKMPDGASMTAAASNRCIVFRDKKPWLVLPDGYTDDGRAKIRLVSMNSPEAQGKVSFEQPIKLIGVPLDQLATPEGRQVNQKALSDNADKLRSIVRSDRHTAQGWTQLKVQNPSHSQRFGNEQSGRKA